MSAGTIAEARTSIGRRATAEQRLDASALDRFRVATGEDPAAAEPPSPVEHWAWFLSATPDHGLGEDGHPRRGAFLPAVAHLPRRMFAGATVMHLAPLLIDEKAAMSVEIADVVAKAGRSGELMFVTIDRTITQRGQVRVTERQTYVYRATMTQAAALPTVDAQDGRGESWTPGPQHLFRFSAATFNAHRIHYDLRYTQAVEHYPALVVQGPLVAARLARMSARTGGVRRLVYQAIAPLFVDQPIAFRGDGAGGFEAVRCDGIVAARVDVEGR